MDTTDQVTKDIVILIEDDYEIAANIRQDLENMGCEVIWLKDKRELFRFILRFKRWEEERLRLVRCIIFDYTLDEDEEDSSIEFVPDFLEFELSSEWILLANSSDDDLNELLVREGCTHSRPDGIDKRNIANYLFQVLNR